MRNRKLAVGSCLPRAQYSLIALATAIGLFVAACGDGNDAKSAGEQAQPFYLEAEVVVVSRAETTGTNLPPANETTTSEIRWWNRDLRHARWELGGIAGVLNGERISIYDEDANTYTTGPIPPLPKEFVAWSLPISVLIGPANSADLDAFVVDLRTRFSESVTVAGSDELLGRRVTVIEGRPASRSSSEGAGQRLVEASQGVVRIWLDEERMMILRYQVEDEVLDVDAVVTLLDYPAEIPDDIVRFEPPPGATLTTE